MSRPQSAETGENTIRRIQAVKMRREGKTYGQIAEVLGVDTWTANRLCKDPRNSIICACGNIAVMKYKGKEVCGACLNPEYEINAKLRNGISPMEF